MFKQANNTDTLEKLQKTCNRINQWTRKWKTKINPTKSVYRNPMTTIEEEIKGFAVKNEERLHFRPLKKCCNYWITLHLAEVSKG